MPSASFLEGRVAACIFLGSGVSTRPYHTVHPTPFPLFLWLAFPWSSERRTPTSATATVQVGHIFSCFIIGQPTTCCSDLSLSVLVLRLGLNSVLFTSLSTNHWRSSLSAFPAIRSTRRFCRPQRLVVVACLLSLALFAVVAAGAGVGGWAPNFFYVFVAVKRRSSRMLQACGARSYGLGGVLSRFARFRPSADTAFFFFSWLAFPWSSERRTPTSATATVRVGHIFSCFVYRSTDDLLLRPFFVGPRASTGLELVPLHQ